MKPARCLLPAFLLAGLVVLGGCGKKEEQPTRFNRTLGGTAVGVPIGTGQIDTGILRDPKGYTPEAYEPLEGAAPGAAAAGGPEVQAIRATLRRLIEATFELDFDTILDSFVPEQVATLREDDYMSTFYETKDTLDAFLAVLKDKATGPEFESSMELTESLQELVEPLLNAVTVTVEDEDNAVATLDLGRLELPAEVQAEITKALAMGASMGPAAVPGTTPGPAVGPRPPPVVPEPNVPGATTDVPDGELSTDLLLEMMSGVQISVPLRKTDDEWKVDLRFSFQEEHAETINDGFLLVKDIVADLTQRIGQVETLDVQTYGQALMQTQMSNMGAIMGFVARAQAMIASILEARMGAAGATEETEEEAATEPGAPEDPNAAAGPPPPGRGRTP
jgi:hypothetical protein